jgi:hypothetical protein
MAVYRQYVPHCSRWPSSTTTRSRWATRFVLTALLALSYPATPALMLGEEQKAGGSSVSSPRRTATGWW